MIINKFKIVHNLLQLILIYKKIWTILNLMYCVLCNSSYLEMLLNCLLLLVQVLLFIVFSSCRFLRVTCFLAQFLLENIAIAQLSQIISEHSETGTSITAFRWARHWFLSSLREVQFTKSHSIPLQYLLVSGFCLSGVPIKVLYVSSLACLPTHEISEGTPTCHV
jgi:hypothetical protein